jgi:multiple sugar transport system ATP-binding protein
MVEGLERDRRVRAAAEALSLSGLLRRKPSQLSGGQRQRVALLNDGVLQQYGTARELWDQPVNLFVASFIGSPEMNLYEAALDPSGALVLGSQRLKLGQLPAGLAARAGDTVIVGIRPEELTPGSPGARNGPDTLAADVPAVQPLGSEVDVLFAIDAAAAGARAQAATSGETDTELFSEACNGVARLDPRAAPRTGERVTFTVDVNRLHFFDPDTGRAMT